MICIHCTVLILYVHGVGTCVGQDTIIRVGYGVRVILMRGPAGWGWLAKEGRGLDFFGVGRKRFSDLNRSKKKKKKKKKKENRPLTKFKESGQKVRNNNNKTLTYTFPPLHPRHVLEPIKCTSGLFGHVLGFVVPLPLVCSLACCNI